MSRSSWVTLLKCQSIDFSFFLWSKLKKKNLAFNLKYRFNIQNTDTYNFNKYVKKQRLDKCTHFSSCTPPLVFFIIYICCLQAPNTENNKSYQVIMIFPRAEAILSLHSHSLSLSLTSELVFWRSAPLNSNSSNLQIWINNTMIHRYDTQSEIIKIPHLFSVPQTKIIVSQHFILPSYKLKMNIITT